MNGLGEEKGKEESKSREAACLGSGGEPCQGRYVCGLAVRQGRQRVLRKAVLQFPVEAVRAAGWRFISGAVLQATAAWLC